MQRWRRQNQRRRNRRMQGVGITGVRATAWGEGTGGVNWGPSAAGGLFPQPGGIMHKPSGGRQRRRCGHSKRRADRTIQPDGEPRATGLAVVVRGCWCRLVARPITDKTLATEIPTVAAYKQARIRLRRWPRRQAGLKPYWGIPTVRNFRGGRGNEVDGLMTVCHAARKGRYIGSHWPNHVRASALLDESRETSVGTTQWSIVQHFFGIDAFMQDGLVAA